MKPYTVILVDYTSDKEPILNVHFVTAAHPKSAEEIAYQEWPQSWADHERESSADEEDEREDFSPEDAPAVTAYMIIEGHIVERRSCEEMP